MSVSPFDGWVKSDQPLETFHPLNAASGLTTAPSGTGTYAWSAWKQLTGTTAGPFVLNGAYMTWQLTLGTTGNADQAQYMDAEIGTGAAASEAAIARISDSTVQLIQNPGASTSVLLSFGRLYPCGGTIVPVSSRLSFRVRGSDIKADISTKGAMYLTGYNTSVPPMYPQYSYRTYLGGVNRAAVQTSPDGTNVAITGSAFPNYSTWSEIISATTTDIIVTSLVRNDEIDGLSAGNAHIELGIGGAGAEVSKARIAYPGGLVANVNAGDLNVPLFVPKGARLAARASGAGVNIKLGYQQLGL